MVAHGLRRSLPLWLSMQRVLKLGQFLLLSLILGNCASSPAPLKVEKKDFIKENLTGTKPAQGDLSPVKTPDFLPAIEDLSPLKTRRLDLALRNTALGDVLHVIAEATGLNLVIEKGVALDQPITITLRNVTGEDALSSVFSSVDYFYSAQDNMLLVQALGTRIIELGQPAIVHSYTMEVGGDILGGATGGSSGGGSSSIKGAVAQSGKTDAAAYSFWDALEKSLAHLLGLDVQSAENAVAGQSVTVNRLTGTIMVTATKRNLDKMERYLDNVKKVLNRQVRVEARIIEVQLSEGLTYGIDWSLLDLTGAAKVNVTAGFGSLNMATRDFDTRVESALPNFRIGASRGSLQSLLSALEEQGDVKTLSNPKINVMNGQAALLSVGRNFSYISNVSTSTTAQEGSAPTTTYTVETSSILSGLMIGIVPYISEDGDISLTITPVVSDLINLEDKTVGRAGENQIILSLPTIDLRELTTTVKVRDGQMVVIGGLISKKESTREEKVPILGDIPWLGTVFTRKNTEETRTELVVVLQPILVTGHES